MHHALAYISPTLSLEVLPPDIQNNSTDVSVQITESLGVDEVRELKRLAVQKPIDADVRVFVIAARALTSQAQNALLKILEEPPSTCRFVFVLPHEQILLDTVRSRVQIVDSSQSSSLPKSTLTSTTLSERFSSIADAAKRKDKTWLASELNAALYIKSIPANVRLLLATYKDLSGSSKKMLLEIAALHMVVEK